MNSSLSAYAMLLAANLAQAYDTSAQDHGGIENFFDFDAASSDPYLETSVSPAELPMRQFDAYSHSFADQEQTYVQEPLVPMEMVDTGYYAVANTVPYAATQTEALWPASISPMPSTFMPTLLPPCIPTSSSLFGALGEALPRSQVGLGPHADGGISPATTQISSYSAEASLPSTPELQYYSSSSSPSSPSSFSDSSSSSDYAPSPRTKRASRPKNAKPYARTSPYSSAAPSPSGSTSSLASTDGGAVRTASIKYTARRSRPALDGVAPGARTRETAPGPWDCPHCDHMQTNHSRPDLNRHINVHFPQKHVCRGERVDLLAADALADAIARHGAPYEHEGSLYVGGCWGAMSRHETLVRHLRNPNMTCIVPSDLHKKVYEDEGRGKGKGKGKATRGPSARKARK
ncbi:hypothetical protein PsYK624_090860 [Phanerochaete sordida]|uniref:C2H2-type domain-containing protein n=1 Tax=Phanerochaete sordida TaxID=48140 RepID=A0A9P3GDV6_9APHY|nr:hypothetical protein PsYK624_090860 [Phanerochaete sordida]